MREIGSTSNIKRSSTDSAVGKLFFFIKSVLEAVPIEIGSWPMKVFLRLLLFHILFPSHLPSGLEHYSYAHCCCCCFVSESAVDASDFISIG